MGLKPLDTAPQRVAKNLIRRHTESPNSEEIAVMLCEAYKRGHKAGRSAVRREAREKRHLEWLQEQRLDKQHLRSHRKA